MKRVILCSNVYKTFKAVGDFHFVVVLESKLTAQFKLHPWDTIMQQLQKFMTI
jgi:hypothetical protein